MPAQPSPLRPEAPADWRAALAPLTGTTGEPRTPLAIGVDVLTGFGGFGFSRFGAAAADIHDVRDGSPLAVALRPMRPAAGTGRWVRGGLTWKTFRYAGTSSSGPLAAFEPTHAELLGRLARLFLAEHAFGTDPGEVLRLDEFHGPDGWALLGLARRTGVEIVGTGVVGEVAWGEPARARLTVERDGADLIVLPAIESGGAPRADLRPAGAGGFFRVEALPERPSARVHLIPAAVPVPGSLGALLEGTAPVRIPAADADEFLGDVAPVLRSAIEVTSRDGSLDIPETAPAPRLQLSVEHRDGDTVRLAWSWTYRAPRRTLPLPRAHRDRGRDAAHEDAVLAAVRRIWADAAHEPEQTLRGADAAHVVEHAIPRLATLADVDVRERGERPDYRELHGTPHLRITQVEPPNAHTVDWLELGFEITLGEHLVPFTAIFSALSQGRKAVLLPDKTYARLDHPTFDALRALIAEAETLPEWNPEHPAIPREQIALWEDFEDLADESAEAVAWRGSVGALRDLTRVEAPPLPAGIRAELRPYQREGLAWLTLLWRHRLGGILADDMGLGKTLQTLALLAHAREERPGDPAFLVVAPSSVVSVWRSEAERFAPHLTVRVLDATSRGRGTPVADEVQGADVVVTSYAVLRLDEAEYTARDWSGLVLDEAQAVKNPAARVHRATKAVRAPFRLAITGTPLENSLVDLWSLLSITAPGLFPSPRAFREEYVRPIETPDASDSGARRASERMARLRGRIRPFVLRRTKGSVAKELPPRQEQVVRIPLQPAHRRLYDRILQRERQKLLRLLDEDLRSHRFIIFRSLTLLRMLALDPAIVDPEHAGVPSSKLEAALERLDEAVAEGHRVLVFSQFTSHLRRVAARLEERGIAHSYLDGSTTGRARVIEGFRSGDAPVFLISLKAGGFGLTLTEADHVIMLDPWWNPAAEAQAIDRAHRIGQDRPVMVHRMVAEDTIEERVLALQERKRALLTSLTDDDQAFTSALTAEDVRELLGP